MAAQIDDLIHQPVRTKIMAFLGNFGETEYTELKTSLELTDGHMSTHMKKLVSANYILAHKSFVNQKPKTKYKLSKVGQKKLNAYLENLKKLIEGK